MWRFIHSLPRVVRHQLNFSSRSAQVHQQSYDNGIQSSRDETQSLKVCTLHTDNTSKSSDEGADKEKGQRYFYNHFWQSLNLQNSLIDALGWGAIATLGYTLTHHRVSENGEGDQPFCIYKALLKTFENKSTKSVLPSHVKVKDFEGFSDFNAYEKVVTDKGISSSSHSKTPDKSFNKLISSDISTQLSDGKCSLLGSTYERSNSRISASSSSSSEESFFESSISKSSLSLDDENIAETADYLANLLFSFNAMEHNIMALKYAQSHKYELAVEYWERAVRFGYAKAEYNLALSHEKGRGTEKNKEKAMHYYRLAAEKGHKQAMYNLAILLEKESSPVENITEVFKLLENSAKKGLKEAQTQLGLKYLESELCDYHNAFHNFEAASRQNDVDGQYYLAMCYENGWGVHQNSCKAAYFYSEAAKSGHTEAQFSLGSYFEHGIGGLPRDISAAKDLYQKAADKNHIQSKEILDRIVASEAIVLDCSDKKECSGKCIKNVNFPDKSSIHHSPSDSVLIRSIENSNLSSSHSSPTLTQMVKMSLSELSLQGSEGESLYGSGSDGSNYAVDIGFHSMNDSDGLKPMFLLGDECNSDCDFENVGVSVNSSLCSNGVDESLIFANFSL